jgi:hypothetical protein
VNRWLQQRALNKERQGVSRTVVICPDKENSAQVADALRRSLAARSLIGARVVLVHTIDEQAAASWRSLGFRASRLSPWTLVLVGAGLPFATIGALLLRLARRLMAQITPHQRLKDASKRLVQAPISNAKAKPISDKPLPPDRRVAP